MKRDKLSKDNYFSPDSSTSKRWKSQTPQVLLNTASSVEQKKNES